MYVVLHEPAVIIHSGFDLFQQGSVPLIPETGGDGVAAEPHPVPSEIAAGVVLELEQLAVGEFLAPCPLVILLQHRAAHIRIRRSNAESVPVLPETIPVSGGIGREIE